VRRRRRIRPPAPADGRTATATAPTGTTATPSPEETTASPTPTATAPGDPVKAEAEVRKAWTDFFSPGTSVKNKAALVENGWQYELMVRGFAEDKRASRLRAHADSVTFTSATDVRVDYTLLLDGKALRPDGPGTAVLQDGTWKISFRTLCSPAEHGSDVPMAAGC